MEWRERAKSEGQVVWHSRKTEEKQVCLKMHGEFGGGINETVVGSRFAGIGGKACPLHLFQGKSD